jgi:hypothetical protein
MFLTGNIPVDINLVPVILHDFGLALVSMTILNLVHLVIFRRRLPKQSSAPAAPDLSERVDDVPAPVAADEDAPALRPEEAKSA